MVLVSSSDMNGAVVSHNPGTCGSVAVEINGVNSGRGIWNGTSRLLSTWICAIRDSEMASNITTMDFANEDEAAIFGHSI